jgi:prepilin-type N-terminal cleavage/methylation domain-containing protein
MRRSKGFSLVELAVALAIIALLLAGALIPLSTQMDVRNVADSRRTMESIRESIVGFAQANGRLPCPANGTIAAGTANAGTEQLNGLSPNTTCINAFGVVPWATLGVPETDGWGRRFSYWVSQNFADGIGFTNTHGCTPAPIPLPTQSSFALCSLGTLTVNTRRESDHAPTAVGLQLPAVIISHGKNGFGAFTPGGTTLAAPTGADEIANANPAATTFFSRIPTPSPSPSSCNDNTGGTAFCEFDDIVVMITSNVLIARMVAAGRLP